MQYINTRTFIFIYAALILSNGFLLVFGAILKDPVVIDVAKEAYTITLSAAIGALSTVMAKTN